MTDLYPRPDRDAIAALVAAQQGVKSPPRGTANADDNLEGVVTKREQLEQTESDVVAWFSVHARIALRLRGWSKLDLARAAGSQGADVTRAVNGQACSLALAGRIASALGKDLASMVQPVRCETCAGSPPAGFACLECASETPRAAA